MHELNKAPERKPATRPKPDAWVRVIAGGMFLFEEGMDFIPGEAERFREKLNELVTNRLRAKCVHSWSIESYVTAHDDVFIRVTYVQDKPA